MPELTPQILIAFAGGVLVGLGLDPALHWLVNARFRISRKFSRTRAASGDR